MSSYYPRPAKEAELDAVFMAWPLTGYARLRAKHRQACSNVRAAL